MHDIRLQKAYARRLDEACNGLSHRAVGELLGLPGETVRRYRKGMSPVPLYVAGELCQKLGVSPVWLVTGSESARPAGVLVPEIKRLPRVNV